MTEPIERVLRTIEKERAEKLKELEALDVAAAALRPLLPPSKNGSTPARTRTTTATTTRRRGMKDGIKEMLTAAPGQSMHISAIRTHLERQGLMNPTAKNPDKIIGQALLRLRGEDTRFQKAGKKGYYVYMPDDGRSVTRFQV